MVDAAQLRLSAAKMVFWKWALGIGVGAACAGGIVAAGVHQVVPPPAVVAASPATDVSPPIEATGTASVGGTPLTTASLDIPVIETPPPVMMLPPDKPPAPPRSAVSKIFRVREPATAGVAQVGNCLPSCETHDPQVVGLEPAPPAPTVAPPVPAPEAPIPPADIPFVAAVPPPKPAVEPAPTPPRKDVVDLAVDGGKQVIRGVEGASRAVVHGTKRAIDTAVDLVW